MKICKFLLGLILGFALTVGASAALAEVVVVVSAENPVTTLSKRQLMEIYLGKATHFPTGDLAVPIDQAGGTAIRDAFYRDFIGRSPSQIKAHWAKIIFTGRGQPPAVAAGAAGVKKRLTTNPDAIGYLDRKDVDGSVKVIDVQEE